MNKDIWMSEVLGRPVYRITYVGEEIPPGCSLAYAKIPSDQVATVSALEERGFRVVDVNVILSRPPGNAEWAPQVVWAHPDHDEELLRIAAIAFTGSRMHLDPLFPDDDANKVKREWIQSYLDGKRGTGILVALDPDDQPVGFLAVAQDRRHRYIDLLATDPYRRRQGAGEALISSFIASGDDRHELRVGTQITNAASLRLYQRMGFEIISARYVLHRHANTLTC